jgi:hypothetical protein
VGDQGWEYLNLGRLWQILLVIGMFLWVVILARGLRTKLKEEHPGNMPWLFLYSALSIPVFYAAGLLFGNANTYAVVDFWRFWVVHLWVEDFPELFTMIMVAYMFVLLGVVRTVVAITVNLHADNPVLDWRGDRHYVPPLFQRRAGGAHGPGRIFLRASLSQYSASFHIVGSHKDSRAFPGHVVNEAPEIAARKGVYARSGDILVTVAGREDPELGLSS